MKLGHCFGRLNLQFPPLPIAVAVYIISAMTDSPRLVFVLVTIALLLGLAASVCAQRNPVMPSQQADSNKEDLYAQFTEYRKSLNPEERRLAYPAAKDYLRKFGGDNDSNARDVQAFVTAYDRALHDGDVFSAYTTKNYLKAFEMGRPRLKTDADDFFVLATLTEAGYENAVAGNATLNDETTGYARRAIKLLEGGKLAKPDPFKNMEFARGFLNAALGWFVKDQAPAEAAAAFLKAAQSDTPYRTDPAIYHRMGVAILKGEFASLSAEYNEKYGAKQASPEQSAMLARVMHAGERAIDAYARAVALMDRPEQQEAKNKILAQLTTLYKNFHNNSDTGLNELIASVLSKPLP
ncbi:MAG: hypothetical protein QOG23_4549 [Blastocatellia bacterium]|nr:hypothetical protein [Blastocatellia bacterium]